jgi:hypothetical protein
MPPLISLRPTASQTRTPEGTGIIAAPTHRARVAMPADRSHCRRNQTIAALGFGCDAMNRVQNHKEGGIGSIYDRHSYADENKRIMEAVAHHLISRPMTIQRNSNLLTRLTIFSRSAAWE